MRARTILLVSVIALAFAAASAPALTPQISELPEPGSDQAIELTAGPDGNLWFVDAATASVGRMTPAGAVMEWFVPGLPVSIVAAPDGNLWFTEENANVVARITPSGTITPFTVPSPNSHPFGIALGADGNVWFTENSPPRVGFISPLTHAIVDYPILGSSPTAIARGPDGNLWFAENVLAVGRATPGGEVAAFAIPQPFTPQHLAPGPDGNVWFIENGEPRVSRIAPDGRISSFPAPAGSGGGIAAGPDGAIWFSESANAKIARITPDGTLAEFHLPAGHVAPQSITLGADGNMWFTEGSSPGWIGRITTPPVAVTGGASGVSRTGATVAGTVNGHAQATSFHVEYGPSSAYGSRTPDQSAGSGSANVAVGAALAGLAAGTTYHYRVVATNPTDTTAGADATFSTPPAPPVPAAAPRLSRLRVSPGTLRGHRGATISYLDSVAARTTLTVQQQRRGVRHGRRCVAPPRHGRATGRRCTRTVTLGRLTHRDVAGSNRVAFGGRLGRVALAPGSYALVAVARAGGRTSRALGAVFAVAR